MSKSHQVLAFLRPDGGYKQSGDTYEGITFLGAEAFSKKEYEAAFAQYDAMKAEQSAKAAADKAAAQAKLAALGLTDEDLKALGL